MIEIGVNHLYAEDVPLVFVADKAVVPMAAPVLHPALMHLTAAVENNLDADV